MEIRLDDQNFDKVINDPEKAVLVDFWAIWCSPCAIIGPILEKIAKDYEDKIILGKANVDAVPINARKYGISQIPTVVLFKHGKPVSGFVGAVPEKNVREWLDKTLAEIEKKEKEESKEEKKEETAKENNENNESSQENQKEEKETEIKEPTKEEIEEVIKQSQKYAEKNGLRLNPNKAVVKRIARGLLLNERKYGARYCPCRRVSGNIEEDRDKICPCKWHKEEIEKNGLCHCGLFAKK